MIEFVGGMRDDSEVLPEPSVDDGISMSSGLNIGDPRGDWLLWCASSGGTSMKSEVSPRSWGFWNEAASSSHRVMVWRVR